MIFSNSKRFCQYSQNPKNDSRGHDNTLCQSKYFAMHHKHFAKYAFKDKAYIPIVVHYMPILLMLCAVQIESPTKKKSYMPIESENKNDKHKFCNLVKQLN